MVKVTVQQQQQAWKNDQKTISEALKATVIEEDVQIVLLSVYIQGTVDPDNLPDQAFVNYKWNKLNFAEQWVLVNAVKQEFIGPFFRFPRTYFAVVSDLSDRTLARIFSRYSLSYRNYSNIAVIHQEDGIVQSIGVFQYNPLSPTGTPFRTYTCNNISKMPVGELLQILPTSVQNVRRNLHTINTVDCSPIFFIMALSEKFVPIPLGDPDLKILEELADAWLRVRGPIFTEWHKLLLPYPGEIDPQGETTGIHSAIWPPAYAINGVILDQVKALRSEQPSTTSSRTESPPPSFFEVRERVGAFFPDEDEVVGDKVYDEVVGDKVYDEVVGDETTGTLTTKEEIADYSRMLDTSFARISGNKRAVEPYMFAKYAMAEDLLQWWMSITVYYWLLANVKNTIDNDAFASEVNMSVDNALRELANINSGQWNEDKRRRAMALVPEYVFNGPPTALARMVLDAARIPKNMQQVQKAIVQIRKNLLGDANRKSTIELLERIASHNLRRQDNPETFSFLMRVFYSIASAPAEFGRNIGSVVQNIHRMLEFIVRVTDVMSVLLTEGITSDFGGMSAYQSLEMIMHLLDAVEFTSKSLVTYNSMYFGFLDVGPLEKYATESAVRTMSRRTDMHTLLSMGTSSRFGDWMSEFVLLLSSLDIGMEKARAETGVLPPVAVILDDSWSPATDESYRNKMRAMILGNGSRPPLTTAEFLKIMRNDKVGARLAEREWAMPLKRVLQDSIEYEKRITDDDAYNALLRERGTEEVGHGRRLQFLREAMLRRLLTAEYVLDMDAKQNNTNAMLYSANICAVYYAERYNELYTVNVGGAPLWYVRYEVPSFSRQMELLRETERKLNVAITKRTPQSGEHELDAAVVSIRQILMRTKRNEFFVHPENVLTLLQTLANARADVQKNVMAFELVLQAFTFQMLASNDSEKTRLILRAVPELADHVRWDYNFSVFYLFLTTYKQPSSPSLTTNAAQSLFLSGLVDKDGNSKFSTTDAQEKLQAFCRELERSQRSMMFFGPKYDCSMASVSYVPKYDEWGPFPPRINPETRAIRGIARMMNRLDEHFDQISVNDSSVLITARDALEGVLDPKTTLSKMKQVLLRDIFTARVANPMLSLVVDAPELVDIRNAFNRRRANAMNTFREGLSEDGRQYFVVHVRPGDLAKALSFYDTTDQTLASILTQQFLLHAANSGAQTVEYATVAPNSVMTSSVISVDSAKNALTRLQNSTKEYLDVLTKVDYDRYVVMAANRQISEPKDADVVRVYKQMREMLLRFQEDELLYIDYLSHIEYKALGLTYEAAAPYLNPQSLFRIVKVGSVDPAHTPLGVEDYSLWWASKAGSLQQSMNSAMVSPHALKAKKANITSRSDADLYNASVTPSIAGVYQDKAAIGAHWLKNYTNLSKMREEQRNQYNRMVYHAVRQAGTSSEQADVVAKRFANDWNLPQVQPLMASTSESLHASSLGLYSVNALVYTSNDTYMAMRSVSGGSLENVGSVVHDVFRDDAEKRYQSMYRAALADSAREVLVERRPTNPIAWTSELGAELATRFVAPFEIGLGPALGARMRDVISPATSAVQFIDALHKFFGGVEFSQAEYQTGEFEFNSKQLQNDIIMRCTKHVEKVESVLLYDIQSGARVNRDGRNARKLAMDAKVIALRTSDEICSLFKVHQRVLTKLLSDMMTAVFASKARSSEQTEQIRVATQLVIDVVTSLTDKKARL